MGSSPASGFEGGGEPEPFVPPFAPPPHPVFVALALGRVPQGMRDLSAYCLRYQPPTYAYGAFLTDRYPSLATPAEA